MSIVGYKARNHPQQVAQRGALDAVDDRRTPPELVRAAAGLIGGSFDLDVAASAHNAQCARFFTTADNGLRQPWSGRVWCNPPYSNCADWVRKAWDEWEAGNVTAIAMLLPANRTEQGWWQTLVEPRRDTPASPLRVVFLPGRIRFARPEGWRSPKGDRPPFGVCLLVWSAKPLNFAVPSPQPELPGEGA